MFTLDTAYIQQRMVELQKEARQRGLARHCLAKNKKNKKSYWHTIMSYFASKNSPQKQNS